MLNQSSTAVTRIVSGVLLKSNSGWGIQRILWIFTQIYALISVYVLISITNSDISLCYSCFN